MKNEQCPYGPLDCPKLISLNERISTLERNQAKLMRLLYYIAGVVSVSLGVNVVI